MYTSPSEPITQYFSDTNLTAIGLCHLPANWASGYTNKPRAAVAVLE